MFFFSFLSLQWHHLFLLEEWGPVTDSSVFIRSTIVLNRWKRSLRVYRKQRRTSYVHVLDVNTVYVVHQGKSVARSLFTLTINEHTITNVCLNLSFLLKIIYIMIKCAFQINFKKHYQLKSKYLSRNLTLLKLAMSRNELTNHSSSMIFDTKIFRR